MGVVRRQVSGRNPDAEDPRSVLCGPARASPVANYSYLVYYLQSKVILSVLAMTKYPPAERVVESVSKEYS